MRAAWGQDRLLAGLRDLEVQLRRDVLVASQNAPPAAESYTPPEDLGIDSFREHLEPLPRLCARLMLDFYSGTDSDLVALRREQVGENEGTSALPSPTCFSFWAGGEFPKPDAPVRRPACRCGSFGGLAAHLPPVPAPPSGGSTSRST